MYDAGKGERVKPKLTGVALVNLGIWNSTQNAMERPYTEVKLPNELRGGCVRRLTGPGAETANNMTFAGRSMGLDGRYVGEEVLEKVQSEGSVFIGASEALLITLDV